MWLSLACAVLAFCVRTPLTKFWSDSDCGETRPFEFEMLPTTGALVPPVHCDMGQEGPGGGIGSSAGFGYEFPPSCRAKPRPLSTFSLTATSSWLRHRARSDRNSA